MLAGAPALLLAIGACSVGGYHAGGSFEKSSAKTMCEEFMSDRLTSPGSAKFGGYDESTVIYRTKPKPAYMVQDYVDSQNGFGAMIRTHFLCEVSTKDGENWHLEDLVNMNELADELGQ
jgi:hypothetical protein